MSTIDTFTPVNQLEYHNHFWNYLMGKEDNKKILDLGRKTTGSICDAHYFFQKVRG